MNIGEVNTVILICEESLKVLQVLLVVEEGYNHVRALAVGSAGAQDYLMRHRLGSYFSTIVNIIGALSWSSSSCKRDTTICLVLGDCIPDRVAWHFCCLILLQAKVETNASKAECDQASCSSCQFCSSSAPFVLGLDSVSFFGEWGRSQVAVNDSLCC